MPGRQEVSAKLASESSSVPMANGIKFSQADSLTGGGITTVSGTAAGLAPAAGQAQILTPNQGSLKGQQIIITPGKKSQTAGELLPKLQGADTSKYVFDPSRPLGSNETQQQYVERTNKSGVEYFQKVQGSKQFTERTVLRPDVVINSDMATVGVYKQQGESKADFSSRINENINKLEKESRERNERSTSGLFAGSADLGRGSLLGDQGNSQKDAQTKSLYTGGQGVISPAQKDTLKIFNAFNTGISKPTETSAAAYSEQARLQQGVDDRAASQSRFLALATGVFQGVSAPIIDTKNFLVGIKDSILSPFETTKATVEEFGKNPEATLGYAGGQALFFKGLDAGTPQTVKNQIPRITVEKGNIPTKYGEINTYTFGVQQGTRGAPVVSYIKESRTPSVTKIVNDGFVEVPKSAVNELPFSYPVAGQSSTVVLGKPSSGVAIGIAEKAPVQQLVGNRLVNVAKAEVADLPFAYPQQSSGVSITVGRVPQTLTQELSKPVPTSVSVGSAKVVENVVNLPGDEVRRIRDTAKVSEALQGDKGLIVKDPLFNVESIPEQKRPSFSRIVDTVTADEGGVFFGSSTTQQLPKRLSNKVVGDVDVYYPTRTEADISTKIIPRYVEEMNKKGIEVRVSKQNPKAIEDAAGNKILEAKSGIDPGALGTAEDVALAGFSGVRFADIKRGQMVDTVRFGQGRAITAGEQTARKGAASSFINPPIDTPELPGAFSEGGVFGKVRPTEPRTLKDVAGFIQGAEGLLELRSQKNPVVRAIESRETVAARQALDRYKQSFNPEQQALIDQKIADITGERGLVLTEQTAKNIIKNEESPGSSAFSPALFGGATSPKLIAIREPSAFPSTSDTLRASPTIRSTTSPYTLSSTSPTILQVSASTPSPRANTLNESYTYDFTSPQKAASPSSGARTISSASSSPSVGAPLTSLIPSPNKSGSSFVSPISSPSATSYESSSNYFDSPQVSVPSPYDISSPNQSPLFESSPRPSPVSKEASPSLNSSPSVFTSPYDSGTGSGFGGFLEEEEQTPLKPKKDTKKKKKGFILEVKKAGKFTQLGDEMDLAGVTSKGVSFIQDTSAASFRIKTSDGQAVRPNEYASFLPSDLFRASKSDRNVVVEKNKYRINTGGERSEITNVGIMASKRKANSLFGR
jgi:hypothetical protein